MQNLTKRTRANPAMCRHNHTRKRLLPPQNHVASFLTLKHKAHALQRPPQFLT